MKEVNTSRPRDPYLLTEDDIKEPPTTFWETIKQLGPGFILSAAIVGSGELIATTTLGARAGFVTFWVVILSCLVKVTLQLEFGKHAISSGETVMTALNKLPGWNFREINWTIWTWLFIQLFKLLQVGGIIGGVAITLNIVFPSVSVTVWTIVTTVSASLLVFRGYYKFVERFSLVMIAFFTVFTFLSVYFLQYTTYAFAWDDILFGLELHLPTALVGVAIAAFGITGVGGDEIMYYHYWCLEKGYAAYTGPVEKSPEWTRRAKGWIRVMYWDAFLSMIVYTLVTAAFYILGAAVLHTQNVVPEGYKMIETLSGMYTETMGSGAQNVFLVCAVVVLFSTLFSALASWTRIFADAFGTLGIFDFYDIEQRRRAIAIFAWVFPILWALLFLFMQLPVLMVIIGGFFTSVLLLIVIFAAVNFRYIRLDEQLKPGRFYDIAFWLSISAILLAAVYSIIQVF
ncbi:Nramp family divalent metal transporter [Aliifodinibius sp. S!AR15-10]|uniref:Nramp family divalent metal transporter n=1 Tax=Aliifodinibius sp. S!AR15-10 TaxID=2950437 RepID=UPI0028679441|nr:Nramp family divalent metal transporter [Aliifodinibius sp. S!AR15-10]MDR8392722.1 Nramp family divalent metal transporter [Aliifodinibius sp. S!AR15-10]